MDEREEYGRRSEKQALRNTSQAALHGSHCAWKAKILGPEEGVIANHAPNNSRVDSFQQTGPSCPAVDYNQARIISKSIAALAEADAYVRFMPPGDCLREATVKSPDF
jgi:hypothetical protein